MNILALQRMRPFLVLSAFLAGAQGGQSSQRIGISGSPLPLGLRQAVVWGLERNPQVRISRSRLLESRWDKLAAEGAFDVRLESGLDFFSDTVQVGSILAGGAQGTLSADTLTNSAQLQQDLPLGAHWNAFWEAQRLTTSSVFNQLNPQTPSHLGFSFELPLWRDFGINSKSATIRIAAKNVEVGQAEFEAAAQKIVTEIRLAYWELAGARERVEVEREGVRLAQEQMGLNQRLQQAGQAAQVDVLEARSEMERRRQDLIRAVESAAQAEHQLKELILDGSSDSLWNLEIAPQDSEEQGPAIADDVASALAQAMQSRPELASARRREEAQRINSEFLDNQTKPRIDLVASYQANGLSGARRQGSNPFTAGDDLAEQRINDLSTLAGLPPLPATPPQELPSQLIGGFGRSLRNLFGNDYRTVALSLRFEFPFSNREAKGRLASSMARQDQLEAERDQLERSIEAEVRNALQAVASARERLAAAQAAREADWEKLQSENRRFRAGETINFFVLTRQSEYLSSRGREAEAKAELNQAVASLQRVLGQALEAFSIRLDN